MRHLYTYLPKDNTAETEGILSTRLAPAGWEKYIDRSGKHTREEVMEWLDQLDPGFKRSNAISVFTEPIPANAHPKIKAFADRKTLYAIPEYKELAKKALVKAVVRIQVGRRGTTRISAPNYQKMDWENIKPGKFLLSNARHYLIETTDGRIPAEYVEKQASDGYLYHGSPKLVKQLLANRSKDPTVKDAVFVAPDKYHAALFSINLQRAINRLERQLGKEHIQIRNVGFKQWEDLPDDPKTLPNSVDVLVRTPENFQPISGKLSGYIYTIAKKKYADKLANVPWQKDRHRELLIKGDVVPERVERVTLPYTLTKD